MGRVLDGVQAEAASQGTPTLRRVSSARGAAKVGLHPATGEESNGKTRLMDRDVERDDAVQRELQIKKKDVRIQVPQGFFVFQAEKGGK
jgi:hypothetical protein